MWAVGLAGFTPIPYKVFTITAGLFRLDFKRFVIASILGRGGRFYLVASLIYFFGPAIKVFLEDYFELVVIGFTVLLVGGFVLINYISKRFAKQAEQGHTHGILHNKSKN